MAFCHSLLSSEIDCFALTASGIPSLTVRSNLTLSIRANPFSRAFSIESFAYRKEERIFIACISFGLTKKLLVMVRGSSQRVSIFKAFQGKVAICEGEDILFQLTRLSGPTTRLIRFSAIPNNDFQQDISYRSIGDDDCQLYSTKNNVVIQSGDLLSVRKCSGELVFETRIDRSSRLQPVRREDSLLCILSAPVATFYDMKDGSRNRVVRVVPNITKVSHELSLGCRIAYIEEPSGQNVMALIDNKWTVIGLPLALGEPRLIAFG